MSDTPGPSPAGWFPDPFGRHEHRWFNGTNWTSDVADGGQRFVDPLGLAPGGPIAPADQRPGNGIAAAAMTCGIIAVLLAWMPFIVILGIGLAILALVFGVKGLRRSRTVERGRGFAITGLVTGGVALAVSAIGIALTVVVWNEAVAFIEPGRHQALVTECAADGRDVVVQGELTNRTTRTRDYTIFASVDERTEYVAVDDVPAGATVEWSIDLRSRTIVDECDPVVSVHGPLPFGLEMDPIND